MVQLNQYFKKMSSSNNLQLSQKSSREINYKIMFITCNYQSKKNLTFLFSFYKSQTLFYKYINALRFYSDYTNVRPASLHHYWQSLQLSPMGHFLWQESFHLTHFCILVARNPRQEQTSFIMHSVAGDGSFKKLGTV